MAKAIWNGKIIAESDSFETVEGKNYFPENSIDKKYFKKSNKNTRCPWKGTASYYTISVDGKDNVDAAWYYSDPSQAAKKIKNHIAFWRGVKVQK